MLELPKIIIISKFYQLYAEIQHRQERPLLSKKSKKFPPKCKNKEKEGKTSKLQLYRCSHKIQMRATVLPVHGKNPEHFLSRGVVCTNDFFIYFTTATMLAAGFIFGVHLHSIHLETS